MSKTKTTTEPTADSAVTITIKKENIALYANILQMALFPVVVCDVPRINQLVAQKSKAMKQLGKAASLIKEEIDVGNASFFVALLDTCINQRILEASFREISKTIPEYNFLYASLGVRIGEDGQLAFNDGEDVVLSVPNGLDPSQMELESIKKVVADNCFVSFRNVVAPGASSGTPVGTPVEDTEAPVKLVENSDTESPALDGEPV